VTHVRQGFGQLPGSRGRRRGSGGGGILNHADPVAAWFDDADPAQSVVNSFGLRVGSSAAFRTPVPWCTRPHAGRKCPVQSLDVRCEYKAGAAGLRRVEPGDLEEVQMHVFTLQRHVRA
jgi:hypothetical protein